MKNKILLSFLISILFLSLSSYSFAANGAMNNARDAVMSTGNAIGNAMSGAANAVGNGVKDLTNGAAAMGNSMTNANGDTEDDATNTQDNNFALFGTNNDDYTATRTATGNNNLLGMSDTTWTWLILGIVGAAIVGLVWYYGKQYEHRNYSND